ncbi:MAG: hypothetical protein J6Y02_16490 [Pseudobutyrivibrio sp.]|nr:hypothetical protein [Pseudobutyrivibrio sp.]
MITAIKLFIFKLLFRKEIDIMALVYVSLIIKGKRTYASVPNTIKNQVKEILIDLELEYLIEE